jgi:Cu/Ag efflux protein CusF
VTLKNDKGEEMTVTAGPEVKNFNQMKVGDVVSVEYLRALALELKKGGGLIVQRTEQAGGAAAKPGEKPAGAVGRQVKVVADVIGLDPATQTVTLKGPQRTVELKIADPEQFKRIAKGDQVEATFTEAVAIAVTPAKKAAAPAAKKEEKRKPKGGC